MSREQYTFQQNAGQSFTVIGLLAVENLSYCIHNHRTCCNGRKPYPNLEPSFRASANMANPKQHASHANPKQTLAKPYHREPCQRVLLTGVLSKGCDLSPFRAASFAAVGTGSGAVGTAPGPPTGDCDDVSFTVGGGARTTPLGGETAAPSRGLAGGTGTASRGLASGSAAAPEGPLGATDGDGEVLEEEEEVDARWLSRGVGISSRVGAIDGAANVRVLALACAFCSCRRSASTWLCAACRA